jgi:hypothetical protein
MSIDKEKSYEIWQEAEATPWDVLCIDLIGPYTIERKNKSKKPLTL